MSTRGALWMRTIQESGRSGYAALAMEETCVFKSVDGTRLEADVYWPASGGSGITLLWIHGGALIAGTRKEIPRDVIDWLVARGFTVALADYRLAPETNILGISQDIQDAYAWLRRDGPTRFGVNTDRIVLVGQSAGGYLALALAAAADPRPAAVVSLYGYGRINAAWSNSLPNSSVHLPRLGRWKDRLLSKRIPSRFKPRARIYYSGLVRYSGGWTAKVVGGACNPADDEALRRFNPEDTITPEFPPTLLVHGDGDSDVPMEESLRLDRVLGARGVPHELMIVRNRRHGFDLRGLRDDAVAPCLTRMIEFLKLHSI